MFSLQQFIYLFGPEIGLQYPRDLCRCRNGSKIGGRDGSQRLGKDSSSGLR